MKRIRRGGRYGGSGGGQFRQSGGGGGGGGGQPLNRNHVFDSSGPDVRLRGTAQQLFEKYLQLGRDASGAGDRVAAEGYFQHAEHYFRILGAMTAAQQPQNPPGERRSREPQAEDGSPEEPETPEAAAGNGNGNGQMHPLEAELANETTAVPQPRRRSAPAEESAP